MCETSEGSGETVHRTVLSEPSLFAVETGISTPCDGTFIVFRRRMSNHCKKSQKARHDIIVAIFKGITVFFLLCLMNETCLVNMRNLRQGLSCHIYLGKCMYNACRRVHICGLSLRTEHFGGAGRMPGVKFVMTSQRQKYRFVLLVSECV